MSDIFISYASVDRESAAALATELSRRGWSVWWDRTIPPGREFDEVIEEALDAARCVVVLWSKASVASSWVKTEAAEAMRRKVLVPALIEDAKIPLEFRRLQAADLSRKAAGSGDEQMEFLAQSVARLLGAPPSAVEDRTGPAPVPPPVAPQARRRPYVLIVAAVVAAAAIAGTSAYLMRQDRIAREAAQARAAAEQERAAREKEAREQAAREQAAREQGARERAARDQAASADAVTLVHVVPAGGAELRSGDAHAFRIRLAYRLASADNAVLAVYFERYRLSDTPCNDSERHQTEGGTQVAMTRGSHEVDVTMTWREYRGAKSIVPPGAAHLAVAANIWTSLNGQPVQPIIAKTGPLACYVVRAS